MMILQPNISQKNESKAQYRNRIIGFTVVFQIALLASKNMVVSTLLFANKYNSILNVLIFGIMILIYARCFVKVGLRIHKKSFYIILASFFFFTITYLFNKQLFTYHYVTEALIAYLVYCLPLIILIPLLSKTDDLIKKFYTASYIMGFVALTVFVLILLGFDTIKSYSMSYGAAVMISSIFLFSRAFRENSLKDLIFAGTLTIAIIALGSRWPLLCVGSFVIYKLFSKAFVNKKYRWILIIMMAILLALLFFNIDNLLMNLSDIFDKFGINSRSLRFALSDNLTYDSGRSLIHFTLMEYLKASPLIGYGAFGGNVIVGLPHSFILDTWANFGFIFGTLILVFSIFMTIKRIVKNKGSSYGELIAIYACMIWPKMTIGESFWASNKYWMLMSLILLGSHIHLSKKDL